MRVCVIFQKQIAKNLNYIFDVKFCPNHAIWVDLVCSESPNITKGGDNPIVVLPASERLLWTLGRVTDCRLGSRTDNYGINSN